jgi:hypothetical protein
MSNSIDNSKYAALIDKIKKNYFDLIPESLLNTNAFNTSKYSLAELTPEDYEKLYLEQYRIQMHIDKLCRLNIELTSVCKMLEDLRQIHLDEKKINTNIPSRDELISICLDAVVHHSNWHDRDSYTAQLSIQDIYKGLTAGLEYEVTYESEWDISDVCYTVSFLKPIDKDKLNQFGRYLEISSLEDYRNDCDPDYETEMFDGEGIDFNSDWLSSYMPTREKLEKANGGDWY